MTVTPTPSSPPASVSLAPEVAVASGADGHLEELSAEPASPLVAYIEHNGSDAGAVAKAAPPSPRHRPRFTRKQWSLFGFLGAIAIVTGALAIYYLTNHKRAKSPTAFGLTDAAGTSENLPELVPPTRVRKSWKMFTAEEKARYLSAVELASKKGYHYRFVEIHTDYLNRITSHGACGFILWHRRFILGYENMLRSLDPKFAELTLPYWNYFEDTSRQLATKVPCNSLEGCSEFLRDFGGGGTTDGENNQSMKIGPVHVDTGSCVSKGIAGLMCDHANGTASGKCSKCGVLRGHWAAPKKIVETLGLDLLFSLQAFNTSERDAHQVMSDAIEITFHNAIHNTLNSTMRYTSSAFDPIFMGHHGMVDLALFIFNRCRYSAYKVGAFDWTRMRGERRFDTFESCNIQDDGKLIYVARGNESIRMAMYETPVERESLMKQFFGDFGNRYIDMADVERIGSSSYTYLIDPYLEKLLKKHDIQCPPYLFASNAYPVTEDKKGNRRLDERSHEDQTAAIDEMQSVLASCGEEIRRHHPSLTYRQRIEQEGLVKCLAINERAGGIRDYDPSFRRMMQIPSERKSFCLGLLERLWAKDLELLASRRCLIEYGHLTGVDLVATTDRS